LLADQIIREKAPTSKRQFTPAILLKSQPQPFAFKNSGARLEAGARVEDCWKHLTSSKKEL
jgi:hypothetical protein